MWLNWGCKWKTNGLCDSIGDVNGKQMGYDSIGDVNGKLMGYVAQLGKEMVNKWVMTQLGM